MREQGLVEVELADVGGGDGVDGAVDVGRGVGRVGEDVDVVGATCGNVWLDIDHLLCKGSKEKMKGRAYRCNDLARQFRIAQHLRSPFVEYLGMRYCSGSWYR